jgi:sterol desaturase/sphingolipid hydroxylase (fatty acid hydroxylase superfamily)
MNSGFLASLLAHYHWQYSLYVLAGIAVASVLNLPVSLWVPTFRRARQVNAATFKEKMQRPAYAANHQWNRKWSVAYLVTIFALILPFCLTLEPQPWWRLLLDTVAILMFYDFFYYLMHRFLFHGPLQWMHAVHHRQLNPCLMDSSYIHPLEVAMGLGLFTASIFILSRFMGSFHVATIVISWVAFSKINVHNHALWTAQHFPFRYLSYLSRMHHNHHARFTQGNFATISLLYDWMFGTLDNGEDTKA